MPFHLIVYYLLLLAACVTSYVLSRQHRDLFWITLVLSGSFIEELLIEVFVLTEGRQYFVIYHLFVPVYYGLFAYYFSLHVGRSVGRKWIVFSIPVFAALSLFLTFRMGAGLFPGMQINIAGVLLTLWALMALYMMDVSDPTPITARPVFWIGLSTVIFYCSDFAVIGLKSYLSVHDKNLSKILNLVINVSLNYLYYLLIIIGLLCSKSTRRYSTPSS